MDSKRLGLSKSTQEQKMHKIACPIGKKKCVKSISCNLKKIISWPQYWEIMAVFKILIANLSRFGYINPII